MLGFRVHTMRLESQRKPAARLLSFQLLTHHRLASISSSTAVACIANTDRVPGLQEFIVCLEFQAQFPARKNAFRMVTSKNSKKSGDKIISSSKTITCECLRSSMAFSVCDNSSTVCMAASTGYV